MALEDAHPDEPHWTGLVLGVARPAHSTGVGRALIDAALAVVDADGVGAYLEVCHGGPDELYRRAGFTVLNRVYPGHGAPAMTTMWRP